MPDTPEQRIADAIWDELERQTESDGLVSRELQTLDMDIDMAAVAHAVTTALGLTEEWLTPGWLYAADEQQARAQAEASNDGRQANHRFVTPWRNAEEEQ